VKVAAVQMKADLANVEANLKKARGLACDVKTIRHLKIIA